MTRRISRKELQTNSPKGTFKAQDPHPCFEGYVYYCFDKSRSKPEIWITPEQLQEKYRKVRESNKRNYVSRRKPKPAGWVSSKVRHRRLMKKGNIKLNQQQKKELLDVYSLRDEINLAARASGANELFHVDHIMPINRPDMTGLHAPWNLQVLGASENIKKSNNISIKTHNT